MSKITDINEMIADMKAGVFDYTDNGKCTNCGQCCGNYLPVSDNEIKKIKQYISKNHIVEQVRNYPTAYKTVDFQCPFRDELNKKCTIYPVRPLICRYFKCDKPSKQIAADKKLYTSQFNTIDMRQEFFGGPNALLDILELMISSQP